MAQLFDKQGNPVEIPDEQVTQALASGEYGLPKQDRYTVVGPDEKTYTVDRSELAKTLMPMEQGGSGFRLQTEDDLLQKSHGGVTEGLVAAATKGASMLSGSLTDQLIRMSGGSVYDYVRKSRKANPWWGTAGAVGAIALGMGRGGAVGKVPKGIAAAGTKAGGAAQQKLAAVLGTRDGAIISKMSPGVSKLAGKAIKEATEGAFYGGVEALSQEAMGEAELSPEILAMHVGVGALAGGAIGTAFGVAGELGKAAAKQVGKIPDLPEKLIKSKLGEHGRKMFVKLASMGTEATEDEIEYMSRGLFTPGGSAIREAALNPQATRDAAIKDMVESLNTMHGSINPIEDHVRGEFKYTMARDLIGDSVDREAVHNSHIALVNELRRRIDNVTPENGFGTFGKRQRKELLEALNAANAKVMKTVKDMPEGYGTVRRENYIDPVESFRQLDLFKRKMRKATKAGRSAAEPDVAAAEEFRQIYDIVQRHLENDAIFGRAGVAQAEINKAYHAYLGNKFSTAAQFNTETRVQGWERIFEADPMKVERFVKDLTSPRSNLRYKGLKDSLRERQELADTLNKFYDLGDYAEGLSSFTSANKRFSGLLADMETKVAMANIVEQMGKTSDLGGLVGADVLARFGLGPAGAAAGWFISQASRRPDRLLRIGHALEKFHLQHGARVKDSVDRMVTSLSSKTGSVASKLKRPAVALGATAGDRRKKYKEWGATLMSWSADPMGNTSRMSEQMSVLGEISPNAVNGVGSVVFNGVQFLKEKYPRDPMPPNPTRREYEPSDLELAEWDRYRAAVEDPFGVIDSVRGGIVSAQSIEALERVYGPWLANVRMRIFEAMQRGDVSTWDRQTKQNVAMLLGISDLGTSPAFVRAMMQTPESPSSSRPSAPGGGAVSLDERKQPAASRVELA